MERHLAGIPARYLAEHSLPVALAALATEVIAGRRVECSIGIGAVQHDVLCVLFLTG